MLLLLIKDLLINLYKYLRVNSNLDADQSKPNHKIVYCSLKNMSVRVIRTLGDIKFKNFNFFFFFFFFLTKGKDLENENFMVNLFD